MRLFLRTYIDLEVRIRKRAHVTCTCKSDTSTASDTDKKSLLGSMRRPIDRVLYKDGQTLLHLTVIMGLRQAFLDVLNEFNADIERLVEAPSSSDYPPHSMNAYSLVAMHSKDSWFVNALLEAGLDHSYSGPLQSLFSWTVFTPFSPWFASFYLFIPPLLHAFDHGCHFLVRFLLDKGASIDEPITPYSTVFDYILSPAIINKGTLRLLFSKKGLYMAEDGAMNPISSSLLPPRLFKEGNGLRVFQLVCEQQQITSNEPLSVLRRLRRIHLCQYPIDVWGECSWKLCLQALSLLFLLPVNILILPNIYDMEQKVTPLGQIRASKSWARFWVSKPLGRHLRASDEAEKDELYFTEIWNELLRMFPHTQMTPLWYREGYGLHLSRSLLAMALIGNKNTDFGPWLMSTPTICHHSRWADDAEKKWSQPDSIAQTTASLYAKTIPHHRPSLVNFFLYDDYDFLPGDSDIAKTLYALGHRHSLLYFHETRAVLALSVLVTTVLVFIYLPPRLGGYIFFYPSLVLALLERPYLHLIPLNLAMLVGWPFLNRKYLQTTLYSIQLLMVIISTGFLIGLAVRMLQGGQLRSPDRFLSNAVLPKFKYTGYSPMRLFGRRSREREFALEDARR